jgi:hypothetical protein
MLPDDEGPLVIWKWIKAEYGPDDLNQIKRDLKNVKMIGIDLDNFWESYNLALASFKAAGGKMEYCDQLDLILENINPEFYLDTITMCQGYLQRVERFQNV